MKISNFLSRIALMNRRPTQKQIPACSLRLALCLLSLAAIPTVMYADSITFGGPDLTSFNPSYTSPYYIWEAGGYWEQSFTTSLSQANRLDLHLVYEINTLHETFNLEALVNGSFVGSFSIVPDQRFSDLSFESTFSGPTFDIRLQAVNTIGSERGAVSLDGSGLSTGSITVVPEPGAFALAGFGAAALMISRRRK